MKNILKLTGVLFLAFSLSCSDGKKSGDGDNSSALPENPTVDVVQEEAMYMRLYDEGKFPYYSSILGSFASKCEIATGNIKSSDKVEKNSNKVEKDFEETIKATKD